MLKQNLVKQKLKQGEVQLGYLQSLRDPCITEILGGVGFDFAMLDGEHSPMLPADMEHLARTAELTGLTPLVRVPGPHRQDICRMLDAGAAGIIVPNVRTRAEVAQAVACALYAPRGERGLSLPRQSGFGAMEVARFLPFANEQTLIVIQIETKSALDNIDDILSVPGVDVALLGPLDMSAALGVTGQLDHPEMLAARRRIAEACQRNGVVAGTFAMTPEQVRQLVGEGFRFILPGVDLMFIRSAGAQALQGARAALGN